MSSPDTVPPHAECLELFRPQRLIFGSDWPVLTTRQGDATWRDLSYRLMARLSQVDHDAVFGRGAIELPQVARDCRGTGSQASVIGSALADRDRVSRGYA